MIADVEVDVKEPYARVNPLIVRCHSENGFTHALRLGPVSFL